MTAGAAYGDGIYLSDDVNLSYGYGVSKNVSAIGVFEVIGEKSRYYKNETNEENINQSTPSLTSFTIRMILKHNPLPFLQRRHT